MSHSGVEKLFDARATAASIVFSLAMAGCNTSPPPRSQQEAQLVEVATPDPVANWLIESQRAFDELRATNRRDGGKGPVLFDPSPILEQYFPRFQQAADAGDLRAASWCLAQMRWVSPTIQKAERDGAPQRWWLALSAATPDDESIRRALNRLDWAMLVDDPIPGCESLVECAREAETRAMALDALASLYKARQDSARRLDTLRRLTLEFPETPQGQNARAVLLQLEVLRQGELFPGYEDRRYIDIGRACSAKNPTAKALLASATDTFALSEYRGKVVVLIFWDYHCGFCLDELPFERELYSRLAPRGVEIIGVYTDPDLPDYKQQSQRNPVPWRNLWDVPGSMRAGPLCRELGVRGVPFTVVLDRAGAVSAVNARNAQLEQAIVKVLERGK